MEKTLRPNAARILLRRFLRGRNGNVAILFALMILPFLGILGMAADYGLALADKSKLDGAADAAALAAVTAMENAIQNQGASRTVAMSAGSSQALNAFIANAGAIAFGTVPIPSVTWPAGSSGQTLTVNVSYSMTMTNVFGKLIGASTTIVGGHSIATLTMPSYINYYIITDTSQSMGVGATNNDMTNLYNRVIIYNNYDNIADKTAGIGCVFGCHVQQAGGSYTQPDSNENLAHLAKYGPKITLRIDSAISAIQSIINDAYAASQQSQANIVKIGVYTMQQDPTTANSYIKNVINPPMSPSTSTSSAAMNLSVSSIDLGNNTSGGKGDTNFNNSINDFVTNILTNQGDGSSVSAPLNYVFFITDGLYDYPGCSNGTGHCTGPLDPTACSQISSKSTVGVIYTTYNPIYANQNNQSIGYNSNYNKLVAPYINNIPTNLLQCAGNNSSYYYQASDGPSITTGMQKLFQASATATRISQ